MIFPIHYTLDCIVRTISEVNFKLQHMLKNHNRRRSFDTDLNAIYPIFCKENEGSKATRKAQSNKWRSSVVLCYYCQQQRIDIKLHTIEASKQTAAPLL